MSQSPSKNKEKQDKRNLENFKEGVEKLVSLVIYELHDLLM